MQRPVEAKNPAVCAYPPCKRRVRRKYCCEAHARWARAAEKKTVQAVQKRCKWDGCGALFTLARADQEYHTPNCRKMAYLERTYTGPAAELRQALENLLADVDRQGFLPANSESIAAARAILEKLRT